MLVGLPVTCSEEALTAARLLRDKGCKNHVLITMGKNGALLLSRNCEPIFVQAPKVQAIDTTVILIYVFITFCTFANTKPSL